MAESKGKGASARVAAAEALEAAAGRDDPRALLDALDPLLADGSDRVRQRAQAALGVLALHAPDVVGPRLGAYAQGDDARRAEAAAAALWGLACRDVPAGVAVLDRFVVGGRDALARRALVQLGFAYRYRPFDAVERAALAAALVRAARSPRGPGKRAVVETARPLRAFNDREDALRDLDALLAALGVAPREPSAARPAPRPRAPCSACGVGIDFAAYFCSACGDVKPHNPLRLLEGKPVERSPPWPSGRVTR